MLNYSQIEKYDPCKMYKVYDRWPEIARDAYESNLKPINFDDVDHIVFAGMGGSGAVGDLFSSILSKTDIHVSLVKGYLLPKTVDKNTLVVTTSISGNTDETLTVLESTTKLNCKVIAFSSGGIMEEFCKKNQVEYQKIESIHSPRTSFIKFIYSMMHVLNPVLSIDKNDIRTSLIDLENMKKKIASQNLSDSNPALNLSNWISGIPLIYYPHGLESAAIRFKSSLQENAKTHVIAEDIIEACHNGIVGWEKPSTVQPILLRGQDDYIKTKQRWNILQEYFKDNKIEYREIFSIKGSIISKLVTLIYLLDYSSIYLAIKNKTDPSTVKPIEYIKNKL